MLLALALEATTNGSGAVTVATPSFSGRLLALHFIQPGSGGITDASIAVTSVNTGESVLSVSGISATEHWHPRGPIHTSAGAAIDYAAAGQPVTDAFAFAQDQLQIAVTGGGDVTSGTFIVVIDGELP